MMSALIIVAWSTTTALLTVLNELNNTLIVGGFSPVQRAFGRGTHRLFHSLQDGAEQVW